VGGGPKWRSRIFFYLFVAVIARWFISVQMESRRRSPLVVALVGGVFIALQILQTHDPQTADKPGRLEIPNGKWYSSPVPARGNAVSTAPVLGIADFVSCAGSPKRVLYAVPKRAFPDEGAKIVSRAANQPPERRGSSSTEAFVPGRLPARITLTVQLKYRDYLSDAHVVADEGNCARHLVCHRIFLTPPPILRRCGEFSSQVFLIMVAMLTPMLVVVFLCGVSFVALGKRNT